MVTILINNEPMTVHFEQYAQNGNMAITITDSKHSPYCHVTTNLGIPLDEDRAFILDTYEDKFIPVPELVAAGIIEPTDYLVASGWNNYRLYKVKPQQESA